MFIRLGIIARRLALLDKQQAIEYDRLARCMADISSAITILGPPIARQQCVERSGMEAFDFCVIAHDMTIVLVGS